MSSSSSDSSSSSWLWSTMNGERAVVVVVIARVLFSLSSSLAPHGLALSLLALLALFVEIKAENSPSLSKFKTRPGASSGILLGVITLPTLMISKLVQLSRASSIHEIGHEELEHLSMQYWATSASCFGVLLFLCILIWVSNSTEKTDSDQSNNLLDIVVVLSSTVLYMVACCLSLAETSRTGFHTVLRIQWLLLHGFAAVKLIQHLLCTFPSCASFGEALLVTSGLVLYISDMLACTIAKVSEYLISSELVTVQYGIRRSEIGIIIQGMLLGLLLLPLVYKFVVQLYDWCFGSTNSELGKHNEIGRSIIFFASLGFILAVIMPSWMQFVQDFDVHPFLWIFKFLFGEPLKRLLLCVYWVLVICLSIRRFYNISKSSKIERILLRKYYHLMAVSMFVPALIIQPEFLNLAFGVALAVFLILEISRVWRVWPLGQVIHQFMNAFTDHRDSDLLIVSHFSLLLGCSLPIWMSYGYNDRPLAPFAGILSLGIGDTMASMVGHKYGILRWSKTCKKTVEGTAAGITSVLAACSVLLPLLASTGYIFSQNWYSLLLAVTVSGLLEAYTAQLDNAFIPLVFYSLLCL